MTRRAGRAFGLLVGSSFAAVAGSTAALAQDEGVAAPEPQSASADDRDSREVIVVTAQRRATNLQDTALAISAFSGEALEERGIDNLSNLQAYVPNLNVGQEQDGFKISLRGIGLQGTSSISDSGVAFYIDNFYIPRPAGGSAIFYDINRIEILRGPQGTLYGRNATGGVVNVISNEPRNRFEGNVGATYASRNMFELRGMLNVPLATNVSARASAVYSEEDGYVRNLSTAPGTRDLLGSDGDLTLRGQLLIGTPDTLEVLVSGMYSDLNGTGVPYHFLERRIGGPPPTQALLATIPPDLDDELTVNNNSPGYFDVETSLIFARFRRSFGSVDAFLQVGRFWQTSNIQQDFDGSPVDVAIFNKDQENDAESVEFRIASDANQPFSWILGAYYFSERTEIIRRVRLNGLTPGGIIALPDFLLDERGRARTYAGFATANYDLSPQFRLSAGIRYTRDEKSGTKTTLGNFGQPFPPDVPNAAFPGEADFSRVTWRGGVEWRPRDGLMLYATVSNGYKAGGFNITSNGAPYDPETITAYEFGIKSDLFDRRVRINLDTFYYNYGDMQLTTLATINNAPGQFTTNAAQSTIYGLELETRFRITRGLTFSASYAYINGEFDEYFNRDPRNPGAPFNPNDPEGLGRTDLSGNWIPYISRHSFNLGLQYDADLGSAGSLSAAVNVAWRGQSFLREYNDPVIDRVAPHSRTDLTLTWRVADTGLSLTGFVTNLENDVQKNNIYLSPGFIGESATTSYTRPRTIGIRANYEF